MRRDTLNEAISVKEVKQKIFYFEYLGTGGLLSLFMGFSFISIIEIFYYATLRPFYKRKRLREMGCMEITIGEPKPAWKNILNKGD